ncbi:MAG: hypothetical protein ACK4YM_01825 [Novosphingobium sp.]
MTLQSATLMIASLAAVLSLLPCAGWTERICAAAMLLPLAIGLSDLEPVRTLLGFQPSLLLRASLETACLVGLLHAGFAGDRWFPLVMSAAALIGVVARGLAFSGLGGPHLPLLKMSALPLLVMAIALGSGMASRAIARSLSRASA